MTPEEFLAKHDNGHSEFADDLADMLQAFKERELRIFADWADAKGEAADLDFDPAQYPFDDGTA